MMNIDMSQFETEKELRNAFNIRISINYILGIATNIGLFIAPVIMFWGDFKKTIIWVVVMAIYLASSKLVTVMNKQIIEDANEMGITIKGINETDKKLNDLESKMKKDGRLSNSEIIKMMKSRKDEV